MISKILLSLFTWFSLNTVFHSEQHFFNSRTDNFQCFFHVSKLIQTFQTDWVESSNQSSLFTQNYCSIDHPVSFHSINVKVSDDLLFIKRPYHNLMIKNHRSMVTSTHHLKFIVWVVPDPDENIIYVYTS